MLIKSQESIYENLGYHSGIFHAVGACRISTSIFYQVSGMSLCSMSFIRPVITKVQKFDRKLSPASWSLRRLGPGRPRPINVSTFLKALHPVCSWRNGKRMQEECKYWIECACLVASTILTISHFARYGKRFVLPTSTIFYMLYAWHLDAALETSPLPKTKYSTSRCRR